MIGQVGQYVANCCTKVVSEVLRSSGHHDVPHIWVAVALCAIENHQLAV
jgi:hypothetical protein